VSLPAAAADVLTEGLSLPCFSLLSDPKRFTWNNVMFETTVILVLGRPACKIATTSLVRVSQKAVAEPFCASKLFHVKQCVG
ncbi:MAG: hypothetical protein ABFC92_09160, partial [Rectinema sp.]